MRQALFAALLASGCASAHSGAATPTPSVTAAVGIESDQDGLLQRALAPVAAGVIAEGYRPSGPLERAFLAPSARIVHPFVLEPRTCVAIVAIASATVTDLDAAIYAPDGSALAEDDTTGARPIVRVCNGDRRVEAYLAFYAFQGTGSFAAQRFERPLGPADALALAELERGASASTSEQSAGFSELLRGLHGRGYEDDAPITEVPLVSGSALRLALQVQPGLCYSVVADGSNLRVRLLDGEGREIALGVGTTGPAALQYCAREAADLLLELSAQGAKQSARLARLRAGQAVVGSARAVWLGEPSAAFAMDTRNAKQASAGAPCTGKGKAVAVVTDARLSQGAVLERELKLSGCSQLQAVLHEGLAVATLRVERVGGAVIAARDLLGPNDALSVCATEPGTYQVTIIGRAGFGAISLARQACGD